MSRIPLARARYSLKTSAFPTARSAFIISLTAIAIIAVACGSAASEGVSDTLTSSEVRPTVEPSNDLDPRILQLSSWTTDFDIHSVPLGVFLSGGPPKDGIRSIDSPKFISIGEAAGEVVDREPVIVVEVNGDVRAYPLGILTRHEIVNDVIGGVSVIVTFCPLCNSAIVFERELNGRVHDFGVSGVLRNSDLVMYDRQTETWWQQFTGEAIVGELTGTLLDVVASSVVSWADFKATHPEGQVLSRDTGFPFDYGFNPYVSYDSNENPFLFRGEPDDRLSPIERVVAVELNDEPVAYPFSLLDELSVVHDIVGGESIVVFHSSGTASALDANEVSQGRDIGASGVFRPEANGTVLTFRADGDNIVDNETNSVWNVLGTALQGPLAGTTLPPIVHGDHFWFAWAAFNPDTRIFEG